MKSLAERLLDLRSRIVEIKARLQNTEAHPLATEIVREPVRALSAALSVMEEHRGLLGAQRPTRALATVPKVPPR